MNETERRVFLNRIIEASTQSTLNGAITNFLSSLELTDRQSTLVANRQNTVRERIIANALFSIEQIPLHGSYGRDTQIRPLVTSGLLSALYGPALDVDTLLLLTNNTANHNKYWNIKDGGTRILNDLNSTLNGYQGISAKIDRPAVTLSWSDMKFEVSPAFPHKDGGYLIPSHNSWESSWVWTDPLGDAEALTEGNKRCQGDLKPLIKMMKCWNRTNGKQLGSFAIETAVYHSASYGYQSFAFEIPHFFSKLLEYDNTNLTPPSGRGGSVPIRLSESFKRNIEIGKIKSWNAFNLAKNGEHYKAIAILGEVFGKPFPGMN